MGVKLFYQEILTHPGLNKVRIVKASTYYEFQQKRNAVLAQWNEQWERKQERDARAAEAAAKKAFRAATIQNDVESAQYAAEQTNKAEEAQKALDSILLSNIYVSSFDFEQLKTHDCFRELRPKDKEFISIPVEPVVTDEKYNPKLSFFTRLSKKKVAEIQEQNKSSFEKDHFAWEEEKKGIEAQNEMIRKQNLILQQQWQKRHDEFYKNQDENNALVDELRESCKNGDAEAVATCVKAQLDCFTFPITFDESTEAQYDPANKSIVVNYEFPTIEDLPNLKSVSYIKSKKEFKETHFSESYMKKKYDDVIYQIVLVIMNVLFNEDDNRPTIEMATLNGKVSTIDRTTGQPISPFILSINVNRESFLELNLNAIDPKAWFKKAKGVSAASLANIAPVAPIVRINKEDKRFIEGYEVAESLDSGMNLAAIDWQDFENLIRELFEKEFQTSGGEVKITQASRDGGVDAVAFDPDPIRGGKIVIQAKRYTNVVGVSAVRDLYGTILNEGATKGILVTTSNFGNDAYNFAKDKPITLMNGANLLYLLEKHGYSARIDLKEAKEIQKQES